MVKGLAWKTLIGALAAYALLTAAYLGLIPFLREFITGLDLLSQSAKFEFRGERQPSPELRVVGITENTIAAFANRPGEEVFYPFPRNWHAAAVTRLAAAGAKVIVLDILFSEADSWDETEDAALRDAILTARAGGCEVVLAASIEDIEYAAGVASESLVTPAPVIMEAEPHLGVSNTFEKLSYKPVELISRRLTLPGRPETELFTQAVEAFRLSRAESAADWEAVLEEATAARMSSRAGELAFFRINYCGQLSRFPGTLYHFESLFSEELEGAALAPPSAAQLDRLRAVYDGAVVFIGSRNQADNDYFNTPYGTMFGVDTNAQAFDTLHSGELLVGLPPLTTLLVALGLALLAWLLSQLRPILKSVLAAVVAFVGVFIGVLLLFSLAGIELSLSMATAGFLLPYSTCIIYGGVAEELAKHRIRGTFSRYVSSEIVDQIIADPSLANLGGMERRVAVLFCDIRNYSTITEPLSPPRIVEFLNLFLGEVTELVLKHHGFVDKYLGDGLMAVFGGPVPTVDPAGDAINCALAMVRELAQDVAPRFVAQGLPQFSIGVGVHYGNVVMGNIGSQARMDYTVIGDAVNVAARVEGLTKEVGWAVLATEETIEAAVAQFSAESLGLHQVKGRVQPVEIYRVLDPQCPAIYRYAD